jgi:hypothetical protein
MIEAKLWRARQRHIEKIHEWRPRRSRYGELVQWDTSTHDWMEGRGDEIVLIAMIDDATSRWFGRFVASGVLRLAANQLGNPPEGKIFRVEERDRAGRPNRNRGGECDGLAPERRIRGGRHRRGGAGCAYCQWRQMIRNCEQHEDQVCPPRPATRQNT